MTLTLAVTDIAAERLTEIVTERIEEDEQGLRIFQRSGGCGCAGLSFGMGIDKPQREDSVVEVGGIRFIVDAVTATNLEGASIDFVDTVQAQGFTIDAPNAKAPEGGGCGCG